MSRCILVLNAGSSSLKFALYPVAGQHALSRGVIDWAGESTHAELRLRGSIGEESSQAVSVRSMGDAVGLALSAVQERANREGGANLSEVVAIGHRVVHGGTVFVQSVVIDAAVRQGIANLSVLAPLHNPPALAAMCAAAVALPHLPQVAVFDTAYFSTLSPRAFLYPVPYEWYTDWGIRRFGFHGISHSYCALRAAEMLCRPLWELKLVICHLGNGCSASAVTNGKAVATTMGFTPLDGLMMGTRPGSLDPGILLSLQQKSGMTAESLQQALNYQSGLLGISGVSSDMRQVEAAALQGHERARLALEMYTDRVRATIGAMAVTLGGLDAVVFTAGVGENSTGIRAAVCQGLEFIGLQLDPDRNRSQRPDCDIATATSRSRILVIETREELTISQDVSRVLRLTA